MGVLKFANHSIVVFIFILQAQVSEFLSVLRTNVQMCTFFLKKYTFVYEK